MTNELFINGKDAYTEWGLFMDESSMSQLRTPPGMKDVVNNKSRLQHGAQYVKTQPVKMDERSLALSVQFTAKNETEFNTRYNAFVQELMTGWLNITTHHEPNVEYKMRYVSCNQYSEFMQGIAKFALKLVEVDPSDRELELN